MLMLVVMLIHMQTMVVMSIVTMALVAMTMKVDEHEPSDEDGLHNHRHVDSKAASHTPRQQELICYKDGDDNNGGAMTMVTRT